MSWFCYFAATAVTCIIYDVYNTVHFDCVALFRVITAQLVLEVHQDLMDATELRYELPQQWFYHLRRVT